MPIPFQMALSAFVGYLVGCFLVLTFHAVQIAKSTAPSERRQELAAFARFAIPLATLASAAGGLFVWFVLTIISTL